MTIETAIKLAIVAGYKQDWPNARKGYVELYQAYLDPLFWQSLAYGMGWDVKEGTMRCENYNPRYDEPGERGCNQEKCSYAGYKDYREVWHHFIDHLAEGKDIESFFTTLEEPKG